ncbi:hypothetical protein LTR62_001701 [Meristemomyces frigidus]|uniref:Uncharacterized protein n=1 Tax=Meristemomyces frigidus TaxID=1508187 RepID=A0AAN7T938_9PEZI|nr:hypothetical protein LTR62_001701 [Meristemomyces frigidus]
MAPPVMTVLGAPRRDVGGSMREDNFTNSITGRDSTAYRTAVQGDTSAPASASTMYLGVGVGVGGAILMAIIAVGIQILRKRAQHRRAATELDHGSDCITAPGMTQEIGEVPRPTSVARCGPMNPLHVQAGWGALSSSETIDDRAPATRKGGKKRNSISLPKRIRDRAIPLRRWKHLSAIIESPRSKTLKSPSPADAFNFATATPAKSTRTLASAKKAVNLVAKENDEDVFSIPGSPKPYVLPSFAIRSPGMYGAAIANDDRPRALRSISVGAIQMPALAEAQLGSRESSSRSHSHSRSLSLGAAQSRPPSEPVPPLPTLVSGTTREPSGGPNRQGFCVSRMSSSSQESASSSVLVTSPILQIHEDKLGSPTVEQMVADDDSAQLKTVTNRQWQNPLITGPRPMEIQIHEDLPTDTAEGAHRRSIHSNTARYSKSSNRPLSISTTSSLMDENDTLTTNRLSIPQIATADRVSISRVSSYNSLDVQAIAATTTGHINHHGAIQKIITPRKPARHSVSATGSPAERRKSKTTTSNVLRDISSNTVQLPASRHTSSGSSNGNPFQWDSLSLPLLKTQLPSALKGSPNSKGSRKGHKRQNCVRISTLTPEILGPANLSSRPTSPSFMMEGIHEAEEGRENGSPPYHAHDGLRYTKKTVRVPRSASGNGLVVAYPSGQQRTSLTPSSPTLSMWTGYQEQSRMLSRPQSLAIAPESRREESNEHLAVSPLSASAGRAASRLSGASSVSGFSIPTFPWPSRATVGALQMAQPVPLFCLSRPSTDDDEMDDEVDMEKSSSPRRILHGSHDHQSTPAGPDTPEVFHSSPPLPTDKGQEYDPAWRALGAETKGTRQEYDPTSPAWWPTALDEDNLEDRSSPAFPFAIHTSPGALDEHISSLSRPTSYGGELPDTPPCSPKTIPSSCFTHATPQPVQRETKKRATEFTSPRVRAARPTAAEKLTSANASAIMATIPEIPPNVGFSSTIPVLAPPNHSPPAAATPTPRRKRTTTQNPTTSPQTLRLAPPAPLLEKPLTTPQPLHDRKLSSNTTSPQGPRSEPAKSVLKSAAALRRMNSEIDVETRGAVNRESRLYVRLNRQASPLLPWTSGEPGLDGAGMDSLNDSFDFDFASGGGAERDDAVGGKSALDDVDFEALGSRLDGALAGFDAQGVAGNSPSPPAGGHGHGASKTQIVPLQSVWEDGERFWDGRPRFSFDVLPSRGTADVPATPTKRDPHGVGINVEGFEDKWERQGSRTPTQRMDNLLGLGVERPSSILRTPRSLYDSDGFLKT